MTQEDYDVYTTILLVWWTLLCYSLMLLESTEIDYIGGINSVNSQALS